MITDIFLVLVGIMILAPLCLRADLGLDVSFDPDHGIQVQMGDTIVAANSFPDLYPCVDKNKIDGNESRTFEILSENAGAVFTTNHDLGSYKIAFSGQGRNLPKLRMNLSFTANSSASVEQLRFLRFLPISASGLCYHEQKKNGTLPGPWKPDGPNVAWKWPFYGNNSAPPGNSQLGYPLPGGRGIPGITPGPRVHIAQWATAELAAVIPLYDPNISWGWQNYGPWKERLYLVFANIQPGQTRSVEIELRVGPGNSSQYPARAIAIDAFQQYGQEFPILHEWPDRRPLAMVMTCQHGNDAFNRTTNPNSYYVGQTTPFDMTTASGRTYFKQQMLLSAQRTVAQNTARGPYAQWQGVIVWDIEGEGDPWATYYGSPNMLPQIAPEMDAIADDYFKVFADAGLRVGVCIRPQQLTRNPKYDPSDPKSHEWYQKELLLPDNTSDDSAVLALLSEKIEYANKRWNVTLFYTDSTLQSSGVLHSMIFQQLAARYPHVLIMPEESTFDYRRSVAPLCLAWESCTGDDVNYTWGHSAFSVNLMNSVPANVTSHIIASVAAQVYRGDVLLDRGWYMSATGKVIMDAYGLAYNGSWCPPWWQGSDCPVPTGCPTCPTTRT
eukprot:m.490588 g.490588  ORF g.490588 m.490588 type:complete len:611 (+) comp21780_c0_seq1:250-2082(+)